MAFLFDQAVQEWSWSSGTSTIKGIIDSTNSEYFRIFKERLPDFERLGILMDYVKTQDGKNRRGAIRAGTGTVHGKTYMITNYGLSYDNNF